MAESVELEISGFYDHNPRKELKSMPWFKLESNIGFGPKLYGISAEGRWLYVYILSMCAHDGDGKTNKMVLNYGYAMQNTGIKRAGIEKQLQVLESNGLVSRTIASGTRPIVSVSKKREEEKRIEKSIVQSSPKLDFESIYAGYPKKTGKGKGLDWLIKHVKTKEKFTEVVLSIRNYIALCKSEQRELKYYMGFAVFLNCYEDYLESNNGSIKIKLPDCSKCGNDGRVQGKGKEIEEVATFRCDCKHGERYTTQPPMSSKPTWDFARL